MIINFCIDKIDKETFYIRSNTKIDIYLNFNNIEEIRLLYKNSVEGVENIHVLMVNGKQLFFKNIELKEEG
jgi:hypothetical protein